MQNKKWASVRKPHWSWSPSIQMSLCLRKEIHKWSYYSMLQNLFLLCLLGLWEGKEYLLVVSLYRLFIVQGFSVLNHEMKSFRVPWLYLMNINVLHKRCKPWMGVSQKMPLTFCWLCFSSVEVVEISMSGQNGITHPSTKLDHVPEQHDKWPPRQFIHLYSKWVFLKAALVTINMCYYSKWVTLTFGKFR